jgi:hypothetical protein
LGHVVARISNQLLTGAVSVISRAAQIQKASGLDVIWIQVGHFFEAYGPIAIELAEKLDMVVATRNGIPKVGFPLSHTRRWLDKTIEAGYSVGLAYQERTGDYRLERSLVIRSSKRSPWDDLPEESFLEIGDPKALGVRSNGPLNANEVFKLITDLGQGGWRMICTDTKCTHGSKYVECVLDKERVDQFLGMTASQGLIIYPQAW